MDLNLARKSVIVTGGGSNIGRAIGLAFAREGATVFLAGRTQATLDPVATEISDAGGTAYTAVVDALDDHSHR